MSEPNAAADPTRKEKYSLEEAFSEMKGGLKAFGKGIASPFVAVGRAAEEALDLDSGPKEKVWEKADDDGARPRADADDGDGASPEAAPSGEGDGGEFDTFSTSHGDDAVDDSMLFVGDNAMNDDAAGDANEEGGREEPAETPEVNLGPVAEFITRDSTILGALACAGAALTYCYWDHPAIGGGEGEGRVPLPVVAVWIVLAYLLGRADGLASSAGGESLDLADESEEDRRAAEISVVNALPVNRTAKGHSDLARTRQQQDGRHSMFLMAANKVATCRFVFNERQSLLPSGFWTNLMEAPSRKREPWEDNALQPACDRLMERLERNPWYSRKKTLSGDSSRSPEEEDLIEEALEPLLKLRGLDVFLSETGEEEIGNHSLLTKCGLRDKPMLICHVFAPFANICIYFEFPEWVNQFGNIVENEDDPGDIKALKRFLNGDEDYRSKRLKLYPTLISGPLAVRYLFSPPSKEFTIWGTRLPLVYHEHHETVDKAGKSKSPCLEIVVDIVSSSLARKVCNVLRSYMRSIAMDVAIVIGTPDGQEEEEPEAFLGTFRLDGIDLTTCPLLPPRTTSEVLHDASVLRQTLISPATMAPSKVTAEG